MNRNWVTYLAACTLLFASGAFAREIAVPNGSFESPVTEFVDTRIDFWQKAPKPANVDTNQLGSTWENLTGLFINPAATNASHINNADGNQLAYLFAFPEVGLFQDYNSTDWAHTNSLHSLAQKFEVGKTYRLTAAFTSSSDVPLHPGSTLQMSLYYRDAESNRVTITARTVTYDTNTFSNLIHLVDFSVAVPNVQAADPWAGQYIGVEFRSTAALDLSGGVWDIDNIRLTEEIPVPNYSFESPATPFVDPRIDSWQKTPKPATVDTNQLGSTWDNLVGLFVNPASTNAGHIDNADGNQLAFLFAVPQAGLFQDFNSVDWSTDVPSHAFNAKFEVGHSYRLAVALTTSSEVPLKQGSALLLALYYRDAASNMVTVASTNVIYDTNIFSNLLHLVDFGLEVPTVQVTNAWTGQNIGILIEAIPASLELIGGVWDLDNVRLTESTSAATLENLTYKNGQVIFNVVSEPGLKFEILASNDLSLPAAQWSNVGTVNNAAGSASFTEIGAASPYRFYRARQIP
jgi:hypothetical protein